ncbi:hypothetical protein A1355_18725 [Methylomonas koyamae]|uniref:Uncharacterized protein n=1 Tax=Methylomonas koyamae TaxID=702114 RepID=A0A177P8I1_9GAMM|nr:hypothetical protein A1355_18725 [Methylomonas koyamae]
MSDLKLKVEPAAASSKDAYLPGIGWLAASTAPAGSPPPKTCGWPAVEVAAVTVTGSCPPKIQANIAWMAAPPTIKCASTSTSKPAFIGCFMLMLLSAPDFELPEALQSAKSNKPRDFSICVELPHRRAANARPSRQRLAAVGARHPRSGSKTVLSRVDRKY